MNAKLTAPTTGNRARRVVAPVNATGDVDAALRLARNGIPVFPCGDNKQPLTKHGFRDATTDEAQIRVWWVRSPNALVGVPTGSKTGLVVIDIDPAGFDFVLGENGDLLETGRRHDTRRGFHYLFRLPEGALIRSSASKIAQGVDVRAEGGYIIWWPAAGLRSSGPVLGRLPLLPEPLLSLVVTPSTSKQTKDELSIPAPRVGLRIGEIAALLQPIDPDVTYDDWSRVLMAVHHETGGSEAGLVLVDEWSEKGRKYEGTEDVRTHWHSFKVDRENIVGALWLKKFSAEQAALRSGTGDRGSRFAVVSDSQFVDRNPLAWHIKGVLPKAELIVIYGQSGSGKSFLVFDMVAAIATGIPWQERKTTKGQVVLVLAEGATGFRNRLRAYAKMHDGSLPGLRIIADAPNLLAEKDDMLLAQRIKESGGADLIVVDTLAASSAGADENAAKDMGVVIEHCKRLHNATGATVLLVHHSGKDQSKGARGWSGLRAASDAEIEVTRVGEDRVATVTKMKDGEDGAKFAFKLVPVEVGVDSDKEPVTSCVVEPVAAVPSGHRKDPQPGSKERTLLDAIRNAASIDGIGTVSVVETVVKQLPKPDGRDTRKQHLTRALQALATKGFIIIEGDTCRAL